MWIFYFFLNTKIYSWQLFMLSRLTHDVDQVKIEVLQKGIIMRGHFCHFF
ncbi:hypothetical protein MtrunA17_Chr6g0476701 [Medicago truncatula]|uniref:Uncharacterized protein n=1 Tax=Medicago truncatula TaxID=3880 RepID=A0A396HFJ9_MEDTR|nr:hypothetical protein MtrunA17_Chr6g0476701 [Medicago truncatula]